MFSVSQILKNEREKQGLTLNQIEKAIRVREKFLKAIEDGQWNQLSSKVYISGIIKNYSDFLGLDSKKISAFFRRDYEKNEEIKFKKRISSRYLSSETKRIVIGLVVTVFLFFLAYFGYQLKIYLSPPNVVLLQPKTAVFKGDEQVKVVGKTEKEALINIFGERIYPDKNGVFEYQMPLKVGQNELDIEVTGANGKKTVFRKIFFRER